MVAPVDQPEEAASDIEKTDELPVLDVASYEATLRRDEASADPAAPEANVDWAEFRPPPVPPTDVLRDVEAWIAAQTARARSSELALSELQQAHTEAQAHANNLALELEAARRSLQTALSRANESERAAQAADTAAQDADSRAARLQTDLESAQQETVANGERFAEANAEIARLRESVAAGVREQETLQQRHEEISRTLDDRTGQVSQLQTELEKLRATITETDLELSRRAEHVASIERARDNQQAILGGLEREREALTARLARFTENAQSSEWKRNVWEGLWHELDIQLSETRTRLSRTESERAGLAATCEELRAQLAGGDAALKQLEQESAARSSLHAELEAARAREQQEYAASAQAARSRNETLAAELKTLSEDRRRGRENLIARETELREVRGTCTQLEQAVQEAQASASGQKARIAELEGLASNLGQALQVQTEATAQANGAVEARTRELMDQRAHSATLEAELQVSDQQMKDQSTAAQAIHAELARSLEQLTSSREKAAALELEVTGHSVALTSAQAELGQTRLRAEHSEASRIAIEEELRRTRAELERETERANSLDTSQREVSLELERARGALDERDLQLRRLERFANSSAQVLSRIKLGLEHSTPIAGTPAGFEDSATLVPLDDSDAPALPLGRRTTIGRAPESDLRLTHSSVSRRHAVVTIGPKGAFIEDVRSVNGVTVNRQRIRHARLADGDVVELGMRRFRFTTSLRRNAEAS
jgi:chromosome segregation ATPase